MQTNTLLLASQSPRRREMLAWLRLPFESIAPALDETSLPGETPREEALRLARSKAAACVTHAPHRWILAADTTVELDGVSLGKPRDPAEAHAMLVALRNRQHAVHTGVTLYIATTGESFTRGVTTVVWMRDYTEAEIAAYVASGAPLDKAGSYGIQNAAFDPVARVERCYANVVGLPLCAVKALLAAQGLHLALDIPHLCLEKFGYHCPAPDMGYER